MAKNEIKFKKNIEVKETQLKEEKIKKYKVKINYVEDNAIVFTLAGYSKRIYFDLPFKQLEYLRDNKKSYINKILNIYYTGDISNAFGVSILPLKNIEDIGNKF